MMPNSNSNSNSCTSPRNQWLSALLLPLNTILYIIFLNYFTTSNSLFQFAWTIPAFMALMFFCITQSFEKGRKALNILGFICVLLTGLLFIFYYWILALGDAFR